MNNISLIGRVTADIELKTTTTGKSVTSFTLAVKRPRVKETTDFIPCVAWEKTAELMSKYIHKGQMVGITGSLTSRKYEKDGQKHTAYDVLCDTVTFVEQKPTQETNAQPASYGASTEGFETLSPDDELPF